MKVKYFGMIAHSLQRESEALDIQSGIKLGELSRLLTQKHPILSEMTFQIAINQRIAQENDTVHPGDEVALLPPFAGG